MTTDRNPGEPAEGSDGGGNRGENPGESPAGGGRTPFRLGIDALPPARLAELVDNPGSRLVLDPDVGLTLDAGAAALEAAMAKAAAGGSPVYGATTGFGGNAEAGPATEGATGGAAQGGARSSWPELRDHQLRLARYLDAGSGPPLPWRVARGVLAARAHVLARGASGVRREVVEALVTLFHAGLAPVIPRDGSLGASGDLVSLAPLARLLAGEAVPVLVQAGNAGPQGEAVDPNSTMAVRQVPGPAALREAGLAPLDLRGRDTLALVNGLSAVTALSALLLVEARRLHAWGRLGAAGAGWALGVRQEAWSAQVNEAPLRQHKGQARVAAALRAAVEGASPVPPPAGGPIQDPYSLRCIPQLLGPGEEFLELAEGWLAAELDGVSDNPVPAVDLTTEDAHRYLSGGNFFGGYVAGAADAVAGVLARLGDLLERQGFLLVGGQRGLPENLVPPGVPSFRHGLKGVHQASSALAMGLQRGAVPATPFARSAEGHNQDVVSNAMQAATALAGQVDRAAALVAAHSTMAAQAVELRREAGSDPGPVLSTWLQQIRAYVPRVEDDTALREPMGALALHLRGQTPP